MERDRRMLWIGLGVVLLLLALGPMGHNFATWPGPRAIGPGTETEAWRHGGGFFFGPVFLIWALIIGGAFVLTRNNRRFRRHDAPPLPRSAEELLRWRYAAGEIGREQYEEMAQVMSGRPAAEAEREPHEGSA